MSSNIAHTPISSGPASAGVESMAGARPRDPTPQWALDVLVGSGLVAFLVLDGSRITYASPTFLTLVGLNTSEATRPASLSELISDADCERLLAGPANAGERYRDICALRGANGAETYVILDATTIRTTGGARTMLVATDVTAWMRGHMRMRRLAFEDALTGLANRPLLYDRIEQAIATARRTAGTFGVLLIDLDRFKPINDIHGHAAGDLVLRETARRLLAATREVDTVARLGGDEFVVLLGGNGGRDEARLVVERIMQAVTAPLPLYGLHLGTSIGIAMFPDDGSDADQLLARADSAMYDAKDRGGNRHAFAQSKGVGEHNGARLGWSPKDQIGVEAVDTQHEELVAGMNSLWQALLAGQDHASLARGLADMTRLLERHFGTEAAHMAAYPYAGSADHRADHDRALETARSLAAHADEQSLALGIRFLHDWLLSHIRSYDAEMPHGAVTPIETAPTD
ncbi:MAG: diguanylate cyclase domain-containing protein [Steroidobacteraceae bacterium]|jgi:diguanylate cyclase (GGDEF)-like protein/hemerythrin-like metal-binding protein